MYNAPRRISQMRARAIMRANPDAIILDVRTYREYCEERIPGAILLPEERVVDLAADVIPNKNALILTYCQGGTRSKSAASSLSAMGYTNVYDIGGIKTWPYERE